MPRLSGVDRHHALGLLQAGLPISEVSLRMNVNRTMIFRLRQRLHLVRNYMNNRFLSAPTSSRQTRGRNNQRTSANTVKRLLIYLWPTCSSPIHQPHPDPASPSAQEHASWDCIQWRSVIFSDKSRFCIDHADGRVHVWRRSRERYQADCVREHNRWGGASLMMWGAISYNDRIRPVFFSSLEGR
ncbi:transposable element Tcb2 transposase [Elysia marginata]|uniref:Transposable element Tcb2 transposase n=1 Tax=Elysia marginata TaxID=1093978 RepID=A0AAV4FI94_9GAST|nr:transposable element Tcb2 transposase [Elysia marginata]